MPGDTLHELWLACPRILDIHDRDHVGGRCVFPLSSRVFKRFVYIEYVATKKQAPAMRTKMAVLTKREKQGHRGQQRTGWG